MRTRAKYAETQEGSLVLPACEQLGYHLVVPTFAGSPINRRRRSSSPALSSVSWEKPFATDDNSSQRMTTLPVAQITTRRCSTGACLLKLLLKSVDTCALAFVGTGWKSLERPSAWKAFTQLGRQRRLQQAKKTQVRVVFLPYVPVEDIEFQYLISNIHAIGVVSISRTVLVFIRPSLL